MILLDTNAAVAAINDQPRIVADRIAEHGRSGDRVGVSSIVLFELRYGVAKSARREYNEERLRHFLAGPVDVWSFDENDAAHAGEVRARWRRRARRLAHTIPPSPVRLCATTRRW